MILYVKSGQELTTKTGSQVLEAFHASDVKQSWFQSNKTHQQRESWIETRVYPPNPSKLATSNAIGN